ncbi:MAG: hypothetical protein KAW45_00790 [Thermoplasmatales archaeon]|nr:hypothetical protein [Thermoplasmatales archaeon]
MNKKIICFLLVICFLIPPLTNCTAISVLDEDSKCYGFIVTYVDQGTYPIIDRINCKIRHLINDLLREQIPIYWTAEDINVDIKKMNSSYISQNKLFEPGSFIIPFTGNSTDDKKIISIMYDYNQSSEIETYDEINIPIYIISEQINVQAFPLNDVKVAQLYSRVTTGGFIFLEVLSKCGFLNVEIIENKNIYSKLNLDDFNVLFHPGRLHDPLPVVLHTIYEDIVYRESVGVRDFINKGGGYIGVCGGLLKASAGCILGGGIPIYQKRQVYNPKLRSIGSFAITDILTSLPPSLSKDVQIKIIDNSSPIAYGLNEVIWDSWFGGHEVSHTGKNVNVVANFHNTGTKIDGTPDWLTTTFGKGKVATFSTHPEIAAMGYFTNYECKPNNGKIIISNSLFHTTAEDKIDYQTHHSRNLTYLEDIWKATANLNSGINEIEKIFNPIREGINETNDYLDYLTDKTSEIISLIEDIADENKIEEGTIEYKFYLGLDFVKDVKIFYYRILKKFLENATTVFDKIELIYYLLKNEPDFNNQLKTLIIDLSDRINKTNEILQNGEDMLDSYKQNLLKYQKKLFQSRIKEYKLKKEGNSFYIHVYSGFTPVIHTYFNSLKFLRHNWYNYEASIVV